MKRKKSTIKRTVRENLTVHLPADYSWKVLDALVQDLNYLLTDDEKTRLNGIIRSRDYAAYLALSEEWGTQCTYLHGKSRAAMHAVYSVVTLLKKFRFDSDSEMRKVAALSKFRAAELACAEYNQSGYIKLIWADDDRMCNAFTYARTFLSKLLGEELPSRKKLTLWSRHGPGANLDTKSGRVSQYFKYADWPYSCTKDALWEARCLITADERWLGALEESYRSRYDIPRHLILDQQSFWTAVFKVVPGNRITFVPKNSQTDRSIAIEPSMNLCLQLGVDGFIRRRLKRWGVDLDSQEKNRELARLGSLNWESPENFATLDLAAASDSISVEVCKQLLPRDWYRLLMNLRSPVGELESEVISYEKISSMGNGFTFALESAIFTSVVYGVMREFKGSYDSSQCAVYGDDLIVPSSIAEPVVGLLNLCGFQVNHEKSFFEGPFRESCGADWFKGAPVRPVFLTTLPTSVMELWTDCNRLRRTLSLRFLVVDSITESLIASWIPAKFVGIRGPVSDEDFDSYWHTCDPSFGTHEFCLWKWRRLVAIPKPVRSHDFLFRKLMHDLRASPAEISPWGSKSWRGLKLSGAGSRFTVTKPGSVTVSFTNSCADTWRQEYAEL